MAKLQSAQAVFEQRLGRAERRTAEEVVGEVLVTAHRAAESMIEKAQRAAAWIEAGARRDALPITANAQSVLEEAQRLHVEAQTALEDARRQADELLQVAREERERLVGDWTSEAERRKDCLEADNMRLEAAIKGLRAEWVGRAAEALARLEEIGTEAVPDADARGELGAGEVVRDLHLRLPTGGETRETGGD
jgi:F0F1-type ATP synthase membrane subunit b/b'